jgi:excisionase family DNA binding protein
MSADRGYRRDWLTAPEASARLGVAADTLRRWIDQRRIPAFVTPGGHRRLARWAIEAFARESNAAAIDPPTVAATTEEIRRPVRDELKKRPWLATLGAGTRDEFRERGLTLTRVLLLQVRSDDVRRREIYARRSEALGRAYGRDCAAHGIPLTAALQVALAVRGHLLAEVRRAAVAADADPDVVGRAADRAFDGVMAALAAELERSARSALPSNEGAMK